MKQRLGSYILDILTGDELQDSIDKSASAWMRDLYRGVDFLDYTGSADSESVVIQGPNTGYAWRLHMLSVSCDNATPVSVYLGESTAVAPVGVGQTGLNGSANECVIRWTGDGPVVRDSRSITVFTGSANLVSWRLNVKQVPGEMIGKL